MKLEMQQKWFFSSNWMFPTCRKYPWIAVNKRLKFGAGKGAAPFQSAIIYLGKDQVQRGGKYGQMYVPVD